MLAAKFSATVSPDHLDCVGVCVPFAELPFGSPYSPAFLDLGLPQVPQFVRDNQHRRLLDGVYREANIASYVMRGIWILTGLAKRHYYQRGAAAVVGASGPIRSTPMRRLPVVLEAYIELADVGRFDRRDHFTKPVCIKSRVVLESHVIPLVVKERCVSTTQPFYQESF